MPIQPSIRELNIHILPLCGRVLVVAFRSGSLKRAGRQHSINIDANDVLKIYFPLPDVHSVEV